MRLSLVTVVLIVLTRASFASPPAETAVTSINTLGLELLARTDPASNAVLSPYSIQMAMSMTFAGARGETRSQMADALHYSQEPPAVTASFARLRKDLDQSTARANDRGEPMTLVTANRLFGQAGFGFRPEYLAMVDSAYHGSLERLDFKKNHDAAAGRINAWVAKETRDRITNLIPPGGVDEATRLVLANAIYLKARWMEKFPKTLTEPRPFHLSATLTKDIPTMQQESDFGYAEGGGFIAVNVPYWGSDFQLLILLPDSVDGLPALESALTASMLAEFARIDSNNRQIRLFLPKFKLEPPVVPLRKELEAMGMRAAFDVPSGSADFDGIAPRRNDGYLFIQDVFHKAFVEIDEEGTEAAAATTVVMGAMSAMRPPDQPLEIHVDRPFLFAIQHRSSGACLFVGRVTDPSL